MTSGLGGDLIEVFVDSNAQSPTLVVYCGGLVMGKCIQVVKRETVPFYEGGILVKTETVEAYNKWRIAPSVWNRGTCSPFGTGWDSPVEAAEALWPGAGAMVEALPDKPWLEVKK